MREAQAQLGNVLITPDGNHYPGELAIVSNEMHIIERVDGVLEVHDPLFERPYCIGDRSLIKDETADEFVKLHIQHFLLHASTRQLSNTEPYETKAGTGRWSRMQHMISTVA